MENENDNQAIEIRKLRCSIQEKLDREASLESFIVEQHVTMSELEEHDTSIKELNLSLEEDRISDKQYIDNVSSVLSSSQRWVYTTFKYPA